MQLLLIVGIAIWAFSNVKVRDEIEDLGGGLFPQFMPAKPLGPSDTDVEWDRWYVITGTVESDQISSQWLGGPSIARAEWSRQPDGWHVRLVNGNGFARVRLDFTRDGKPTISKLLILT